VYKRQVLQSTVRTATHRHYSQDNLLTVELG
jgi:hypothetical protein